QLHHALAPIVFALALAAFFGCGYLVRRYEIGLQHRPNARYPIPLWPLSTRKDHKPYSAGSRNGATWNIWCVPPEPSQVIAIRRVRRRVDLEPWTAIRHGFASGVAVICGAWSLADHLSSSPSS